MCSSAYRARALAICYLRGIEIPGAKGYDATLYQRKIGRNLFDHAYALQNAEVNPYEVIRCYRRYTDFFVDAPPSHKRFIANMVDKMVDSDFTGETAKLLLSGISFTPVSSW